MLERIRASGRPLVLFTNGSHVPSAAIARGLREDGLPIADAEMLTPIDSATRYLRGITADAPVLLFGSAADRASGCEAGISLAEGEDVEAVLVAHIDEVKWPRWSEPPAP